MLITPSGEYLFVYYTIVLVVTARALLYISIDIYQEIY